MQVKHPERGLVELILMFETEDDATRFAVMLEAQDFPAATVESMDSEEIEEFCQSAGYECELIRKDDLQVPPEANLDQTSWQPETGNDPDTLSESELDRIRRRLEGLL